LRDSSALPPDEEHCMAVYRLLKNLAFKSPEAAAMAKHTKAV
jgi:hypothetical protein